MITHVIGLTQLDPTVQQEMEDLAEEMEDHDLNDFEQLDEVSKKLMEEFSKLFIENIDKVTLEVLQNFIGSFTVSFTNSCKF